MTPTILIVGKKKSGKTTLATKLIAELTRRGLRVGAIKHTAHEINLDQEGRDSALMKAAGAVMVGVASGKMAGFYREVSEPWTPEDIRDRWFEGVEVVIGEGFKEARLPKIAVMGSADELPIDDIKHGLLAVVSDKNIELGVPRYAPDDVQGMADLVQSQIAKKKDTRDVFLFVNGRKIYIKPFIKDFLMNVVVAMVDSLKGTEGARSIIIRVQNAKARITAEEE